MLRWIFSLHVFILFFFTLNSCQWCSLWGQCSHPCLCSPSRSNETLAAHQRSREQTPVSRLGFTSLVLCGSNASGHVFSDPPPPPPPPELNVWNHLSSDIDILVYFFIILYLYFCIFLCCITFVLFFFFYIYIYFEFNKFYFYIFWCSFHNCHESGNHSLKLHITHGLHLPSCTALTHSHPPLHPSHSCHHSLISLDCLTCTSFTHTHLSSTLTCTHCEVLFCPG